MNAELVLIELLNSNAALFALVGNRISPDVNVQASDLPSVTYHRISTERAQAMGGPNSMVFANFQVDSRALKYLDAKKVAHAVRLALDGYRGTLGIREVGGIFNHGEFDFTEVLPGSEKPIYGVQQEYRIACRETVVAY